MIFLFIYLIFVVFHLILLSFYNVILVHLYVPQWCYPWKEMNVEIFSLVANKAILSIFYGRRIPTEVFVPCRRKKK